MTTTTMTADDRIAAAWQAMENAREAFREQVRTGFNGAREYLAWVQSVQAVTAAGGARVNEYENAQRARDLEHAELCKEARRLQNRDVFEQLGAGAVAQWERDRAAWLVRATAYAGRQITVVAVDAPGFRPDEVRGESRPQAIHPPEPLPYLEALMTACRGD